MFGADKTRTYNWYISLVAASCMVLYGYDASVYNAVQGSKHWVAFFHKPVSFPWLCLISASDPTDLSQNAQLIGAVNTAYTVGAVAAGWFMGGPLADYAGRRVGMAAGAFAVIIATLVQTFSPNIGCFIAGRVIVGIGQGLALSKFSLNDTVRKSGV